MYEIRSIFAMERGKRSRKERNLYHAYSSIDHAPLAYEMPCTIPKVGLVDADGLPSSLELTIIPLVQLVP
jgi:hypothetical protein